jgi:L-glyceraldehyde 3-phosphate reductase
VKQLEDNAAAMDATALTSAEIEAIEPFAVHGTQLR